MSTIVIEAIQSVPSTCLVPWIENPYKLITWWDVHNFAGTDLHSAISVLERIRCEWIHAPLPGDPVAAKILGQRLILTLAQRQELERHLSNIQNLISNCGLPVSSTTLSELRADLLAHHVPGLDRLSAEQFIGRIEEIQRTIRREMQTTVFLYIQNDEAKLYSNPIEKWESVVRRWPQTQIDISECSRCLALDRYAAAIFHVLLVAEFGVIKVTDLLNESGDKPGWGGVQRLERILQKTYKDRTSHQQKHSKLLTDIVPMMVAVKDSARHKISHVDNRLVWLVSDIGPLIAQEVIAATRGFMRRLASELPTD